MSVEESFLKAFTELARKYPVLKQPNDQQVKVRVVQILQLCRAFHSEGYSENNLDFGKFADLFKNK